ncbi:MAG: alpha/beta fold hydrolase, partial [Anaerolineae bacterium]|nr:alpha/beta fold hydrolase [Anaerolineae bacterium]
LPDATVFALDLPGRGRSAGPGLQTVAGYAGVLVAWLEALAIPQAVFVGHSMGGAIAQTLALDHADRVAGLVLIGTGARLRVHPDLLDGLLRAPELVYDQMTAWMWAESVPEAVRELGRARLGEVDPAVLRGDFLACDAFDERARVGGITAPTLVIGGTADRMMPLKFSQFLADQIVGAELVRVEGGGHMLPLEQPDVVAGAVADWLARRLTIPGAR